MKININDFSQEDDVINFFTSIPPVERTRFGSHGGTINRGTLLNTNFLNGKNTICPKEFFYLLRQALTKGDLTHALSDRGMPCRVMRGGQPWQKGKIVISVEFIPDPIPDLQPEEVKDELNIIRDQA